MTQKEIEYLKNINLDVQIEDLSKDLKETLKTDTKIQKMGADLGVDVTTISKGDFSKITKNKINVDKLEHLKNDPEYQNKMLTSVVSTIIDKKGSNVDLIKLISNYLDGGKKGIKTKYLRKNKKRKKK